ncbi:MAG: DNA gyrase subunit A [Phycisphaerales bacterium]
MALNNRLLLAPDAPSAGGGADPAGEGPTPDQPGTIVDLKIERELQDSYLTYAMSTIMDRALPDVRDGLKPSQRRILVAMNDLRLFPGRKHLKCAKICGDTSGNYHPHGESVIYPTLVIMGQKWRMRQTLIDPQGNFGSITPDPPAAMRYTEARMTSAAVDLLADIDLRTVDFQPNYDDRLEEPTILPGKFPNLMVNGGVGIAVGMATSMAPNNPVEVLDTIIRLIERPETTLVELMQDVKDAAGTTVRVGIKGPDFPTGGTIMGRRGIIEGYETGRGRVVIRARMHTEPVPGSKDREQLVIDELPYNVSIEVINDQLKAALADDKITDLAATYNESSSKNPVRVVVELKKGADAGVVEKQLYEFTSLQQSFSINNIALVNRQPRTLPLREMVRCYIEHRAEVIRRRTAHLLQEARKKAHLLEGMIHAVCDIDEVIKLIRSSRTRQEAIEKLMARRFRIPPGHPAAATIPARLMEAGGAAGAQLSRIQAETIGGMRLIQLVGLELERLVNDYRVLLEEIEGYERILGSHQLVLNMITADCEEMRARYNTARQTEIQEAEGEDLNIAALIPVMDCAVTISHQGYAKRVPLDTYKQQGRGGKGIIAGAAKEDDFIEHLFVASTHDDLMCFTNTGRVFKIKVFELPELARTSKGRPLVNIMDFKPGERAIAFLAVKNFEEGSHFLTTVTANGIVKRTALKDYRNVHKGGLIAVDIREGDTLLDVILTGGEDDVMLVTAQGMAIRFAEDDVRVMGRGAGGVKGIELAEGDGVIGVVQIRMTRDKEGDSVTVDPSLMLLTLTEKGYGKRTAIDEYRVQPESGKLRSQSRGGKGRADIDTGERNGRSVAAMGVVPGDDVVVGTKDGQLVRLPADEIRLTGRGAQGVRVVSLNEGDSVTAANRVPKENGGPETETPA